MEFKFIDDIFQGLTINLNVLKRTSEPYTTLLYQHEGVLSASDQRIGNRHDAAAKLRSYFTLLKETGADLALVPEYCCPFALLNEILNDPNKRPASNKLWAIGMESIKKDELVAYLGALDADIISYFDHRVLAVNKNFLDPLIYIFKAIKDGEEKLIVLVQFKNYHMGVWSGGDVERDNMIPGNEIYILRNCKTSVHMLSVVCSEAMNLSTEMNQNVQNDLLWGDVPFLVLNPQVNPGPSHPFFLGFRNFVLSVQRTEIIGLNWNNTSKIGGTELLRSKFSRSGIYTRTTDMNFKNLERIRENHKRGLYYFYYGADRHAFLLNSGAHAFLLKNTSVNINEGVAVQRMRNGPHLLSTYVFDANDNLQSVDEISDRHIDYLNSVGCRNAFLSDPENCVIEKELLACLSTGELPNKSSKNWSELNNIWSVKSVDNTEINRRITVAEDMDAESTRIRDKYAGLIEVLGTEILKNPTYMPDSLSDLRSEHLLLGYSKQRNTSNERLVGLQYFRCNITTVTGEMVWATVCYLDMASDERIGRVFEALQGLFDHDSRNRDRVVVFYKRDGIYQAKSSESSSSIKQVKTGNENSFLK
ncbi:hypothetical protein [Sphingobacterium sp. UME9]|uniref:hypothetical protein n=1 Tax=Sphingobacterium sp. UME9 TaxID=1862316 RepID=UPI0015FEC259|nr:hypothetical protein [Sphingobacterium sp. UME9]MBB1644562.1 hypothetical protein [Sphingobacterium sp. UME9]